MHIYANRLYGLMSLLNAIAMLSWYQQYPVQQILWAGIALLAGGALQFGWSSGSVPWSWDRLITKTDRDVEAWLRTLPPYEAGAYAEVTASSSFWGAVAQYAVEIAGAGISGALCGGYLVVATFGWEPIPLLIGIATGAVVLVVCVTCYITILLRTAYRSAKKKRTGIL
jgi:hypothetical protein